MVSSLDKSYGVDVKAAEKGKWMTTQEGTEVRVAKMGCPAFVAELARLQKPVIAILRSDSPEAQSLHEKIAKQAMAKTILLDCKVYVDGKKVKHTSELGEEYFNKHQEFYDDVQLLSASRANFKAEQVAGK